MALLDEIDLELVSGGQSKSEKPANPRTVNCPICQASVTVNDMLPGYKYRKCPNGCPDFFA